MNRDGRELRESAEPATPHRIDLVHLRLPLRRPYHLAFGDLRAFDTVLVSVRTRDGREGWGETTPLPGYSHETVDDVWDRSVEWARAILGRPVREALGWLEQHIRRFPFAGAALTGALEALPQGMPRPSAAGAGSPDRNASATEPAGAYAANGEVRFPLIGTVRSTSPHELAEEIPSLLEAGYTTLKIKVGTDVRTDQEHVRAAQQMLGGRGRLRIDANQGYGLTEAREFLDGLRPEGIELFEQPFPPDRWEWMEEIGRRTPVPLMLDESVLGEDDVRRAAELPGVRYVKFKLMKAGSTSRLRTLVDLAHAMDLGVVVGNGVAGEIGCLHEARAVVGRVALPGEMNGFLKPAAPLLTDALRVVRGELVIPPAPVTLIRDQVERFRVRAASASPVAAVG